MAVSATMALVGASALEAQRQIRFPAFDASIEVHEDGSIDVLEQITVDFDGTWNGIFRRIPVKYDTEQGFTYRLLLDVGDVTDADGNAMEHWVTEERGYRVIKIRVPGASDARRVVWIRYSVANALRFFEDYDELYWNVTGTEWDVPIARATARVTLPEGVTGIRTAAYTGYFGSGGSDAQVQEDGNELFFETTRPLEFREGLTVDIAWDPGAVARPGALIRAFRFLRSNLLLALPLLPAFFFFNAWSTRGRDPKTGSISAQYEPPDDLRPAELGTLIDNRPDMRDLTATLVDLAVRGYIRFEEVEKEGFLKFGNEVEIHRVKPENAWSELRPHERRAVTGLFTGGSDSVRLSDLKAKYYTHLSGIKDGIWDHLLELRYYDERPDSVRTKWVLGALFTAGAVFLLGQFLANRLFLSQVSVFAAAILTAIPCLVFAALMPSRTKAGVRALEKVLGFEEFLKRVDADRIQRMNLGPESFEAFLPYAMSLGVESAWARAFEGIYREPPDWYRGSHVNQRFHTGMLVNDLNGFTSKAASTLASAPSRSSSGSGFSSGGGGGFSGGGFGGGGGGGW